jgi:hypothetical protein
MKDTPLISGGVRRMLLPIFSAHAVSYVFPLWLHGRVKRSPLKLGGQFRILRKRHNFANRPKLETRPP